MITTQDAPGRTMLARAPHFGDDGRARAFASFLEHDRGERQIVVLQDFPDPDAISSAMAYRALVAEYDIDVDVVYEGRISHQENLALVNILSIELIRFAEGQDLEGYDGAVYIDNQGTTTRLADRLDGAGVPALAIIDHHALHGILQPEFTDVRPVGAAATILVDYLRSGVTLDLDPDEPAHGDLATALMHGLRTETNGLVRAGPEELLAASYLSRLQDPEQLEGIMRVQRAGPDRPLASRPWRDLRPRGEAGFERLATESTEDDRGHGGLASDPRQPGSRQDPGSGSHRVARAPRRAPPCPASESLRHLRALRDSESTDAAWPRSQRICRKAGPPPLRSRV